MSTDIKNLQLSLQSIFKDPEDNLGWSFDYRFLKDVADRSEEIVNMEQVNAILLAILQTPIKQP